MTVVNFPTGTRPQKRGWQPEELRELAAACSDAIARGQASEWEIGVTERGEPQLYLIGPPPGYDCILCISRIGGHFVIEDGRGQVMLEHDSSLLLAEQALSALRRRKAALLAQVAAAWQAFREAFEEKTEALTSEPAEILVYMVPQLATLA